LKVQKIRKGKILKTIITEDNHGSVHRSAEYSEIDNLDTKTVEEAVDNYEKTFVAIRNILEANEQFSCDDETDRLSLTQCIADALRKSCLIRKEGS
jgi:hypothetical protein